MTILVRYAEIGIKGKNREKFERALAQNIEACLRTHRIAFSGVRRIYGRIIIDTENPCAVLRHVFGIASFSQAIPAGKTIDEVAAAAKPLVASLTEHDSFRITCQRLDKAFPLGSRDICVQLGDRLRAMTKAKVRMANPTVEVMLEVVNGIIYVLFSRTEGPGGMPVGSQGTVLALIEDDASVLAALLVMKRGCAIIPAVLQETDLSMLKAFAEQHWREPVKVAALDQLDAAVAQQRADAIVVNDALGSLRPIRLNALVLRPLSGMTPEEVARERQSFADLLAADRA